MRGMQNLCLTYACRLVGVAVVLLSAMRYDGASAIAVAEQNRMSGGSSRQGHVCKVHMGGDAFDRLFLDIRGGELIIQSIPNAENVAIFILSYSMPVNRTILFQISRFWCSAKWHTRENCEYSLKGLRRVLPEAADSVTPATISYYRRCMRALGAIWMGIHLVRSRLSSVVTVKW